MRTWSVRGTAFALCTRSSSLSIRTSTSICSTSLVIRLVLRIFGGSGPAVRKELAEATGDGLWHELIHLSSERRDLLHAARGDEAHLRARHHVDGLDVGRERAVELVHLELVLEVGDHAQALDDHLGVPTASEDDDELLEDLHLDVRHGAHRVLHELDALL